MLKLLEVSTIDGRWALVQEYIEGITLEELMNQNPDKLDEYLDLFVKIQLDILGHTVPLLNRIKDKFKRKLTDTDILNENTRYELLQRIEGMKNHTKLCHGDLNPSNIIMTDNGEYYIIDWAHATQGNASADAARSYLLFSLENGKEVADKYLEKFCVSSEIDKKNIQRWIPLVAATQLMKEKENQEFLRQWIDIVDFE
jgi:thiamine kinase-like enzyme